MTQTCNTCHQVFDSISARVTHSNICKQYTAAAANQLSTSILDERQGATNEHVDLSAEPDYFCGCCYQYFATIEQYNTHKSANNSGREAVGVRGFSGEDPSGLRRENECAEEYGMQLMAQEPYEDEAGWREYEYEQEDERMEDFRQNAISEAVCRRCQRYFHVCKCN
jgi:hypothetical protein